MKQFYIFLTAILALPALASETSPLVLKAKAAMERASQAPSQAIAIPPLRAAVQALREEIDINKLGSGPTPDSQTQELNQRIASLIHAIDEEQRRFKTLWFYQITEKFQSLIWTVQVEVAVIGLQRTLLGTGD